MTAPKWLSDTSRLSPRAAAIWSWYAPGLRSYRKLRQSNLEQFRTLCRLLATAEVAAAEIEEHGATVLGNGGRRRPNPAAAVLIQAQRQARPLLKMFGLDGTLPG